MNAITPKARTLTLIEAVDELGRVKAQVAALTRIEEKLKTQLKASGKPEINGVTFRATVSESERETLDMEAVRTYFNRTPAGKRWIKAHTNSTPTTTVRVVAQVRAD